MQFHVHSSFYEYSSRLSAFKLTDRRTCSPTLFQRLNVIYQQTTFASLKVIDVQHFEDVLIKEFLLKQDLSENKPGTWEILGKTHGLKSRTKQNVTEEQRGFKKLA